MIGSGTIIYNTAGLFKAARKAETMQKLDGFMLTFIKECIANDDL